MNSKTSWKIRLAQILLGAGFLLALVVVRGTHAGNEPIHIETDWSHRRVVFSAPQNLGQHVRLLSNPRYVQQLVRRGSGNANISNSSLWRWRRAPEPTTPTDPAHRDWSVYLGSGGTVGAGSYPAKYSFNPGTASCDTDNSSPNTNNNEDFVVYNTGLVPSAAGTDATRNQTFTGNSATNGTTFTITNNKLPAPNTLVLYANTGTGGAVTATGTITAGAFAPSAGNTVTLGAVTYTFETGALTAGTTQVSVGGSANAAEQNLRAAIDDSNAECVVSGCFASGITAPNPVVTHPAAYNGTTIVTLTAVSDGAAGNFTLSKANGANPIVVAGGTQGLGANDGKNFLDVTNVDTAAANLAAAIARNGGNTSPAIGVTATNPGAPSATVAITSTNTGTGGTGATFNVDISIGALSGLTVATPLTGGGAGASIVAYDNVCPGGTGTVPWTYWAYNTGGQAVTSPVLSGDGKQVAFVQNVGTTGQLVLLKWAQWDGTTPPQAPTIDTPITLTTQASAAAYTTCTAPCMYTIAFPVGGTITDTNSDPFYDFANDIIYVGDDGGHLRKFTGVFKGTPLQVSTGGFPVTITNTGVLTSPVFDDGSGYVFVGSSSGRLTRVLATNGVTTFQSAQVGANSGINDSPILDPTTETVYVITSDTNSGTFFDTGIYTFAAAFPAANAGTLTVVSASNPGTAIYDGDFDNAFYNGGAGHLYVCAPAAATDAATLYQVAISAAGVLGAVTTGPALSTSATLGCTGVTEFFNPSITNGGANPSGTDFIFLGVSASALTTTPIFCPSATGCLMSFDVTAGTALTTTKAPVATLAVPGGPSGIVVDNDVSTATTGTGAGSQVYFSPLSYGYCTTPTTSNSGLGIGGCGIQASQAGLE